MKFEKIQAGQTLYDVHSFRMGNTSIRSMGCWDVKVLSVDSKKRNAVVRWNGNNAETWSERDLSKLRAERPVMATGIMGSRRLLTRAEKAARKAAKPEPETPPQGGTP